MQLKVFEEQIFFTTVRITVDENARTGTSIGTGFLYRTFVSDNKFCLLLVSNKHVYGDPQNPIQLNFNKKDPKDPTRPLLGQTVSLQGTSFNSIFTPHPDPSVDLACINVSKIGDEQSQVFYKCLDETLLSDFKHERLLPGNDVWFVGYPENRFDTKNNLPILRRGYIASIPKVDYEGRCAFLIDAQVFQGSSGSPVFTNLGGKYKLVGVVSQTMIKNEKIHAVPTSHSLGVAQILGLGIVLKANLLTELLSAATLAIKTLIAKKKPEPTVAPEKSGQIIPADASCAAEF